MSLPEDFYKKYIIRDEYMPVIYACFFSSVAFAFATFPFSMYSFIRCLRHDSFKGCYIYRLIALNGIANCIEYTAYMITNQIGTLPNMNGYFAFLMDHKLAQLCQFSLLFSSSAQSTFNMFISLNRLLSIVRASQLKDYDKTYFNAACILASILSIAVSIPVFFANCFFEPVVSATGQTHYVAVVIEINLIGIGFLYFMGLGIMANKTTHNSFTTRVVVKVEQGLLVSVVFSSFLQLVFMFTQYISLFSQDFVMTATGSIIMALYTGAPFWSLIIFVPSFRHCVIPRRPTTSSINSIWTTSY